MDKRSIIMDIKDTTGQGSTRYKVYLDSRKMKVNYRSIGIDNIAGIRIEKRMETVDAIREYPSEPYSPSATPIYSLGGQKLTSDRHALQKGIYIIRGKKILVK